MTSTHRLVDETGATVESYRYEPFGEVTVYDGAGQVVPGGTSALGNPYLWSGRRKDPETGLYYFRNRYYSAVLGRFVSEDPLGPWEDALHYGNPYAFAGNGPTNWSDPLGLQVRVPPRRGLHPAMAYTLTVANPNPDAPGPGGSGWLGTLWSRIWYGSELFGEGLLYGYSHAARCRDFAQAVSQRLFRDSSAMGPQDAVRHCLLACCLRKRYSRDMTNGVLNYHERFATTPKDRFMDNSNNALGLLIAELPGSDCIRPCFNAVANGIVVQWGSGSIIVDSLARAGKND